MKQEFFNFFQKQEFFKKNVQLDFEIWKTVTIFLKFLFLKIISIFMMILTQQVLKPRINISNMPST